jgi:hypothetical protein
VFNKSYHAVASRGGLVSAGDVIQELVERAADRQRAKKRSGKLQGVQLELFPAQPAVQRPPADRPLGDLFPEA